MESGLISSLLDHPVSDGVLLLDRGGRCIAANPAARRRGLDQLVERHATSLAGLYSRLLDGIDELPCELPDTGMPLRGVLKTVRIDSGTPMAFSLSIRLSEDLDDWLEAAESGGHALWVWDLRHDQMRGSGAWIEWVGMTGRDAPVPFATVEQRIHPDDRAPMREALHAYLEGESSQYLAEYRCERGDGDWRWVRDSGRVTARDAQGRASRVAGTLTCIDQQKRLEQTLREQRGLVEDTQRLAGMGSWQWAIARDQVNCAPDLRALLGIADAASVRAWLGRCRRADFPTVRRAWRELRERTEAAHFELTLRGATDDHVLQIWASAQCAADGRPQAVLAQIQDVTRQRQADAESRRRGALLRRVAELGRIGGCEIDADTRTLHWTGECAGLHGREGQSLPLEDLLRHYTIESREALQSAMSRVAAGAPAESIELCFYRPDGQQIWTQAVVDFARDPGMPPRYLVLFRDISGERAASERIERLAHYDALTGLPNRTRLRQDVDAALAEGGSLYQALLLLDISGFGGINEAHGHAAGDLVLKAVAARLHMLVDAGDLFGRIGADEFVVLLQQGAGRQDVAGTAQRIVSGLSDPVPAAGEVLRFGVSAGIAVRPPGVGFDELLRAAGVALHGARQHGRNHIEFYSPDAWLRARRRLEIEHALRGALEHEEFSLAYQPLIALDGHGVCGIEALLRWHHPELGPCAPDEFIEIAEATGDIVAIGEWVLREACRQAAAWYAAGLRFGRMSVNVSAVQLRDPGFTQRVLAACSDAGWPAAGLELEITESALLLDTDALWECFGALQSAGVALAVDDFGTGFSSLSYLSRFPVGRLKIDRSFIAGLAGSDSTGRAVAVTRAIIHLGKALRMQVLAEGVESGEDERLLRDYGCDEVQGYLYSRPLPPREMVRWLQTRALIPDTVEPRFAVI
ncbi:EAL domain-containing protein [Luteimonas deserti]|uniref:EAL domain-containing protein n=1 Tax=Luteimonas deserti TaxID=2752306 RepID=A0A7Z0QSY9_9GAMM|nr:EAL domain-containing protein [Luteimonas deserti]NYZ64332.1 EAL domain-containing protein [Luteimonas deserti]